MGLQGTSSTSEESRQRAIRLESKNLRKNFSSSAILHAAQIVLGELGHRNAKKIMQNIIDDPSVADKLMDLVTNPSAPPVEQLSRIEALSFLIHHNWSENDYRYC